MEDKTDIKAYTQQFYRGNHIRLLLAMAQSVVLTAANLLISWLIQQIIDLTAGGDTGPGFTRLAFLCALSCGLVALAFALAYVSKPKFISRAMGQYSEYVFRELCKKGIVAFQGENTALYISALSNDTASIENNYLANIFVIADQALLFAGALALMFWYSPLLTLISIALSALPLVSSLLTGNMVAKAEKTVSDKNSGYMGTLKDCLVGFSVIKAFRAEAQICRIYARKVGEVAEAKCVRRKLSILVQCLANLAGNIVQLGVFLIGAYLALRGRGISSGTVLVFVQLLNFVITPIGAIPQAWAERKASRALIEKVASALAGSVRDVGTETVETLEGGIELKKLSFAYEAEKPVLKDISFTFEAGKRYALVGPSGSGKSTLLNLLMASHGNYQGEILYDGTELRDIKGDSLYDLVSLIAQNVFVFNASIRDNITMFSDFPREDVDRAIALSGLSALIAGRGEEYLCGENGSGLSGGEKQRIAIARSLLRKAGVLLVDEATAALDPRTAFQVSGAILDLGGLTRIVVTHSLDESLLRRYDCILTLKNGRIAEAGSFDELMEKKGYFYSLYTVSQ